MKQEEEEVDIESGGDVDMGLHVRLNGARDEDTLWAEDEPDEDEKSWKMKLIMEDENGS